MTDLRTKIVCTIGPASESVAVLERLIQAGMRVARVNFSHGTHEGHAATIANIRAASERAGIWVPVLQDLSGPKLRIGSFAAGKVVLEEGVICALRHIHMSPQDALEYGLRDRDMVRIRVEGERPLIFGGVLVRINPGYRLAMHIDTDEANACCLGPDTFCELVKL
mgnify:CR=1 FL=1